MAGRQANLASRTAGAAGTADCAAGKLCPSGALVAAAEMASLLKDSRLSTGVLSMRFMQRKAEVELAERLGSGSQDSQWRGAGISRPSGSKHAGPIIVYDQRRDTGASRSYSRRSFGNFNITVEATEATEATRDGEEPAKAAEQPALKKTRRDEPRQDDDAPAAESENSFRAPADAAATRPEASGEKPGGWRGKLEKKRKGTDGDGSAAAGTKRDAGTSDTVSVGSTKKNKKNKKKKRKMSAA